MKAKDLTQAHIGTMFYSEDIGDNFFLTRVEHDRLSVGLYEELGDDRGGPWFVSPDTEIKYAFSQPEPINHNELKRLLMETLDEVYAGLLIAVPAAKRGDIEKSFDRVVRKIDRAVLNGDDS